MIPKQKERIQPFVGWGAALAVVAGSLQQLGRTGSLHLGELLGNVLGGALLGSAVWWWRNR